MIRGQNGQRIVYVGTYTRGRAPDAAGRDADGIYIYRMDAATGELERIGAAAGVENPSFLALHPGGRHLYSVNELEPPHDAPGGETGGVTAFSIDAATGHLTLLNQQPSHGNSPCHLCIDRTGRAVVVANYRSGSACVLPVKPDGSLGPADADVFDVEGQQPSAEPRWAAVVQHCGSSVNRERQAGPHAHCATMGPGNEYVYVVDLGLDRIMAYRLDAARARLQHVGAVAVRPGAGPRHITFHPNGRWGYLVNELDSTVIAYTRGAGGQLDEMQTISALPAGFRGENTAAGIQVAMSGRHLYASNRGHDSIAIYAISPDTGRLTCLGHEPTLGRTPRHFTLDPTGTFLLAANQDSDSVAVFRVNPDTGRLSATGEIAEVPSPTCITPTPHVIGA